VPTLVHDGEPIRESTIINEYIDAAFPGPPLTPADPLLQARMRETIRRSEDAFDAIVKLTMVKYILPKLKNRWGLDELLRQAARRPTRYLQDVHSRAVRGEITEAELGVARRTIEQLLDQLEATIVPGHWIIKGGLSLADITVAPYMFRLSALGSDQFWHSRLRPNVSDWYERLSARPAFRVAVLWPDESGGGYEEVGLQTSLAG
jgi:glutathione S-transferase